jgi:hypothetical protein
MSDNSNGSGEWLSSDSVAQALNYLRQRMEQFSSSPDQVNELLELLRQIEEEASVNKQEHELLSLLLDDALRETDIASRYPIFFKKLLGNEKLREAFLDSLDLLEQTRAKTLKPLPGPASRNLDFLSQNSTDNA